MQRGATAFCSAQRAWHHDIEATSHPETDASGVAPATLKSYKLISSHARFSKVSDTHGECTVISSRHYCAKTSVPLAPTSWPRGFHARCAPFLQSIACSRMINDSCSARGDVCQHLRSVRTHSRAEVLAATIAALETPPFAPNSSRHRCADISTHCSMRR